MRIDDLLARQLRALGFDSYWSYLQSPHWQSVSKRYRESDLLQSCICGAARSLQLHHKTYERLGTEHLEDLILLCRGCHQDVHYFMRRGWLTLDLDGLVNRKRAADYRAARRPIEAADPEPHRSLSDRLRLIRLEARDRHIDISSELRVIEQRIAKGERKVRLAAAA
jgi:hypothetical protein